MGLQGGGNCEARGDVTVQYVAEFLWAVGAVGAVGEGGQAGRLALFLERVFGEEARIHNWQCVSKNERTFRTFRTFRAFRTFRTFRAFRTFHNKTQNSKLITQKKNSPAFPRRRSSRHDRQGPPPHIVQVCPSGRRSSRRTRSEPSQKQPDQFPP